MSSRRKQSTPRMRSRYEAKEPCSFATASPDPNASHVMYSTFESLECDAM